ncbi:hypothetical protein KAR91_66315, partial [Candidatus Pacearchaeota archaeon]|nr:hypothetical protein [Candidatus Pacearchaeota archaeon]
MSVKTGIKTTEFWVSVGTAALGVLVLFGMITPDESSTILSGFSQAVGGVMTVVPTAAYAWS